jgi:hypothetical protein
MSDQQGDQDPCRQSTRAPSLPIPPWLPQYLVSKARELHARELKLGHASDAALIVRLVTDSRMQVVWQELTKRKRDSSYQQTDDYHHAAIEPVGISGDKSKIQDAAILELFIATFAFARAPMLPGSSIPYDEMAKSLRRDADTAAKERPRKQAEPFAKKLISTAAAYERLAKVPIDNDQVVIKDIIECMKTRFGPSMHKITATLASVALDQKVSVDRVRDLSRRKRATKTRGKPARKVRGKKARKSPKSP